MNLVCVLDVLAHHICYYCRSWWPPILIPLSVILLLSLTAIEDPIQSLIAADENALLRPVH